MVKFIAEAIPLRFITSLSLCIPGVIVYYINFSVHEVHAWLAFDSVTSVLRLLHLPWDIVVMFMHMYTHKENLSGRVYMSQVVLRVSIESRTNKP